MRELTADDIDSLLDYPSLIEAVRDVFKSVGHALEDLADARMAFARAGA